MAGKKKTSEICKQVVAKAKKTPVEKDTGKRQLFVSTGSTLLNLALTDHPLHGFPLGKMVNVIGDQSSGKTVLALTVFAEAMRYRRFRDYRLIYDDAEAALEFDLEGLFGKRVAEKIEPPALDEDGDPKPSSTVQEFGRNVINALDQGSPFIYVLDSFDALSSEEEEERTKAESEGKLVRGTYGVEKAKVGGAILRQIVRRLNKSRSLLIIISQTRENLNPMSFTKKTRSGGRFLNFYATHELWLAVEKKLKTMDRMVGIQSKVKVSKNKITGKLREVSFPIYFDYGIDDLGSMVDFLVSEKVWTKRKRTIETTFGEEISGTRSTVIEAIEKQDLEPIVIDMVGDRWREIEEALRSDRKRKYS